MQFRYRYLIAMGSNLGERQENLQLAIRCLNEKGFRVIKSATPFENPPIGNADKMFLNSACLVDSSLGPSEMVNALLEIERSLGRVRTADSNNRTIDLDIILAKDLSVHKDVVINEDNITIPHPRAHQRDFVLIPAAEICGDWVFTGSNMKVKQLANQFSKSSKS